MTPSTVPVSVVVPTIGRVRLLGSLLDSLNRCSPLADEILIVDQSSDDEVRELVERFGSIGARLVFSPVRQVGYARNVGLREASHEVVLVTDDDCEVATDWVSRAAKHMQAEPAGAVTGQVLPAGDPVATPSIKVDPAPHDYTNEISCSALFPNNMALPRTAALALGGFDEHLPRAQDNDFCYRWLRHGHPLRYEPDMVVWHKDWRAPEELRGVYRSYARGQGMFYAKHLRAGDLTMLRFIASDAYQAARALAVAAVRHRPAWSDWRRAIPGSLPGGIVEGWKLFGPRGRAGSGLPPASEGRGRAGR